VAHHRIEPSEQTREVDLPDHQVSLAAQPRPPDRLTVPLIHHYDVDHRVWSI
jgi:hypothetical protein